jgi:hypothetical protein
VSGVQGHYDLVLADPELALKQAQEAGSVKTTVRGLRSQLFDELDHGSKFRMRMDGEHYLCLGSLLSVRCSYSASAPNALAVVAVVAGYDRKGAPCRPVDVLVPGPWRAGRVGDKPLPPLIERLSAVSRPEPLQAPGAVGEPKLDRSSALTKPNRLVIVPPRPDYVPASSTPARPPTDATDNEWRERLARRLCNDDRAWVNLLLEPDPVAALQQQRGVLMDEIARLQARLDSLPGEEVLARLRADCDRLVPLTRGLSIPDGFDALAPADVDARLQVAGDPALPRLPGWLFADERFGSERRGLVFGSPRAFEIASDALAWVARVFGSEAPSTLARIRPAPRDTPDTPTVDRLDAAWAWAEAEARWTPLPRTAFDRLRARPLAEAQDRADRLLAWEKVIRRGALEELCEAEEVPEVGVLERLGAGLREKVVPDLVSWAGVLEIIRIGSG